MKKTVLSLLSVLLLLACSSDEREVSMKEGRVPLQIKLEQNTLTRSILESKLLPEGTSYGVYVTTSASPDYGQLIDNGGNRCVTFSEGKSIFDNPVYIPEYKSAYVWAYYPYNDSNDAKSVLSYGLPLEVESQTDYLVGNSIKAATESYPEVSLSLKHALSRIHVTVKRSTYNFRQYTINSMNFSEMLATGKYVYGFDTCTPDDGLISVSVKPKTTLMDDNNMEIEADVLVIPNSTQTIVLGLEGSVNKSVTLPSRYYVAGEMYSIEVVINHEEQLQTGEWQISPWIVNEKEGFDFWADDTL